MSAKDFLFMALIFAAFVAVVLLTIPVNDPAEEDTHALHPEHNVLEILRGEE